MWLPLPEDYFNAGIIFINWIEEEKQAHTADWLPDPLEIVRSRWLADFEHKPEYTTLAQRILLWIETARAAGYGARRGGSPWLPSHADFSKSALFERIRHGVAPLAEPPPLGFSCPWYAVVEDQGPHFVGMWSEVRQFVDDGVLWMGVLQNRYSVDRQLDEYTFVVADMLHQTSYRFRLWFNAAYRHPSGWLPDPDHPGGWMIRSTAFDDIMIQI